jgi:hypothetical protein
VELGAQARDCQVAFAIGRAVEHPGRAVRLRVLERPLDSPSPHTEAKVKLIQLANDSYWERVRLEEALAQAEIARDPDEDEDYGEIPS